MCPKCGPWGGLGYIKVFEDHGTYTSGPRHYHIERCSCKAEEDKGRSLSLSKTASDFSPRLQKLTFDMFQRDWQHEAFQAAWTFAHDPLGWLFLYSAPGRGKTHLEAAITNYLLEQGRKALYVIVPEMLQYIRDGFNPEEQRLHEGASQRLRQIRSADVLLLDDLGAEKGSAWAIEQLYLILDYRYREELPTVVASNLTPDTLPAGMMRISDRLQDSRKCKLIRMDGKSYRKYAGERGTR
jgi:DNA replication protein DnaC